MKYPVNNKKITVEPASHQVIRMMRHRWNSYSEVRNYDDYVPWKVQENGKLSCVPKMKTCHRLCSWKAFWRQLFPASIEENVYAFVEPLRNREQWEDVFRTWLKRKPQKHLNSMYLVHFHNHKEKASGLISTDQMKT